MASVSFQMDNQHWGFICSHFTDGYTYSVLNEQIARLENSKSANLYSLDIPEWTGGIFNFNNHSNGQIKVW
jgi:hypothetical protein